jgi:hypothetical protein
MEMRNPAPEPLVLMVWIRMSTALALLIFNAYCLFRWRKEKSLGRLLLYISSGVAIICGLGVTIWILEYPAKFTWRIIFMDYFQR